MDRLILDSLYEGSRGSPARVFKRAVSENPLDLNTYKFLLDHVAELDVESLVNLFKAQLAPGVNIAEKPFVRRLAEVLPDAGISFILEVLRLSRKISLEAWDREYRSPP